MTQERKECVKSILKQTKSIEDDKKYFNVEENGGGDINIHEIRSTV